MTSSTKTVQIPPILSFGGVPIRERFTAVASDDHEDKVSWPRTKVDIFDTTVSSTEPIYTYGRNYSFLRTFEPFRLFVDGQWRNYALISPKYTTFQVIDLDNREIVAERGYPPMPQDVADSYNARLEKDGKEHRFTAGDPWTSVGFCPTEFHVPDILDIYDDGSLTSHLQHKIASGASTDSIQEEINSSVECVEEFLTKRTFGLLSGCVWGDDWSMKIQSFDLTGIPEGVVSEGPDFGYVVQPDTVRLKDVYDENYYIYDDFCYFVLHLPVSFRISDDHRSVMGSKFYGSEPNGFTTE